MWVIEAIVVAVFCWALSLPALFSICGNDTRMIIVLGVGDLAFFVIVAVIVNGLKFYGYIPVQQGACTC